MLPIGHRCPLVRVADLLTIAETAERLRAACTALAALVQRDRVALYEAHHYPHSGEIDDEGREALAEYDAALALADQAMGSEG